MTTKGLNADELYALKFWAEVHDLSAEPETALASVGDYYSKIRQKARGGAGCSEGGGPE